MIARLCILGAVVVAIMEPSSGNQSSCKPAKCFLAASCQRVKCRKGQTCAIIRGADSNGCPTCDSANCVKAVLPPKENPPIYGCPTLMACNEYPKCPAGCGADKCVVDKKPLAPGGGCYLCPVAKCI